jgi:chorismate dehydratase
LKKPRIALVEYLNTLPFSEGIKRTGMEERAEVRRVIPSACATLYAKGEADISLCPIGALDDLPPYKLLGKYCIGADGKVGTVVLLSRVPLDDIRTVMLDSHSRTSNLLLQILADKYWKRSWIYATESEKQQTDACLMIGDKVFVHRDDYPYSFDLGEAWKSLTGKPMVFAVWIATPETEDQWGALLDKAFENGMEALDHDVLPVEPWQKEYLKQNISYPLDEQKLEAMQLYLEWSRDLVPIMADK